MSYNDVKTLSYMIQKYYLFQETFLLDNCISSEYNLTIKPNHNSINYIIEHRHKDSNGLNMHKISGQFYCLDNKSIKENYNDFIKTIEEAIEAENKAKKLALELLNEL